MSKKVLGKGLEALFDSGTGTDNPVAAEIEKSLGFYADIEKVAPNPDQPRKDFDEESLNELAESIREKGVLQPVLVERKNDSFVIIAGERRYRAALIAGLKTIPVIEKSFSGEEKLEAALIENIHRENLTPIEEAKAYRILMGMYNIGQDELARKIGRNRSTIANSLRLLKMPVEMQKAISSGDISAGHARAVLSVVNPGDQQVLFNRILKGGLSVRESEKQAAELNSGIRGRVAEKKKDGKKPADPDVADLEQKFMDILGTRVKIKGSSARGTLQISYFSSDDLDRIYEVITGNS